SRRAGRSHAPRVPAPRRGLRDRGRHAPRNSPAHTRFRRSIPSARHRRPPPTPTAPLPLLRNVMSDTTSGSTGGSSIIGTELVSLDVDLGSDKNSVIAALAERLAANGRASDADALTAAVLEREAKSATGLPGGIAIPHARSEAVTTPSLGFARLSPKADFGAPD